MQLKFGGKTNTYTYYYHGDGRERQIVGSGSKKAKGTTNFTYDANDKQIRIEKGKGDGMDRNEVLTFVYNNDGQILYRFHDEGSDDKVHSTEYQYANGNPVGERKTQGSTVTELLDSGQYNLVQNLGEDFPSSAVTSVTVLENDTLQAIAARVYGNPSLWFVIAEANGLDGSQPLKAGTRLTIPNTIESGAITADAHAVYNESDIIGSTLPNLKTPKKKGCGNILAIIIVVVIAVVVAIFAPELIGVLGEAIGGLLGSGAIAGFVGTVIAAGIVAAGASIVQQGLMIAMGYQDSFSWKAVGQAALTGALTAGIGAGFDRVAGGLNSAANATSSWAKVAQVALQVGKNATTQLIQNGKITSWTSLAASALGTTGAKDGVLGALNSAFNGQGSIGKFVTPWLDAAETYIRNGELTAGDWANAVGRTLGASFDNGRPNARADAPVNALNADKTPDYGARFEELKGSVGRQALIAGAMAFIDRQAAAQYFASNLGQEVGNRLGAGFTTGFQQGQERAREATENRNRSAAENRKLSVDAAGAPNQQLMQAPQPATAASTLPFNEEELELSIQGMIEDQLEALVNSFPLPQIDITRTLEPGKTLWALAKDDLGPGATNAQIQERAQQYMEVNGITDPRRLQAGQELKVPSGSETLSTTTRQAYAQSDVELREYYAVEAATAALAATRASSSLIRLDSGFQFGADAGENDLFAGAGVGLNVFAFDPALAPDNRVLFGQKRMSPNFGPAESNGKPTGRPEYLAGRDFRDVAADLRANRLSPDQLPIEAFEYKGRLVSVNTRSLAALAEAGMQPTNIKIVERPSADVLARLGETPILEGEKLPSTRVPVTRGADVITVVELPSAPVPKLVTGLRVAGGTLTVVGVATDAYSLGTEINSSIETGQWSNTAREATRIGGGWTGAWAGASAGGSTGAAFGGAVGAFFFGAGAVPGAAIGGFLGSLGGGIAGYWGGSKAATTVYDAATRQH